MIRRINNNYMGNVAGGDIVFGKDNNENFYMKMDTVDDSNKLANFLIQSDPKDEYSIQNIIPNSYPLKPYNISTLKSLGKKIQGYNPAKEGWIPVTPKFAYGFHEYINNPSKQIDTSWILRNDTAIKPFHFTDISE